MSNSPNLALPYIAANQAQKHVTHNDAIAMIDGIMQLSVVSRGLNAPPVTFVDGNRFLIGAAPTNDWLNQPGQIAFRNAGLWQFLNPRKGWVIWIEAESILLVFDGNNWVAPPVPQIMQNMTLLGVNATADSTNKFSVNSSAALFNNIGNGMQIKLNKNAVTDTASFLYQTGFSGRAELGTTGDDAFHFKVSADGATWKEALVIDPATGLVRTIADPTTALGLATKQYVDATASGAAAGGTSGQIQYKNGTTFGGLTLSGDATVNTTSGVMTIASAAVSNAKLASMASATIKGNNSGAVASAIDLTAAQVKTLLAIVAADVSGLGALATAASVSLTTQATGTLQAAQEPAHTGDVTNTAGSLALTIAASAVTNAKLATMAANSFKLNNTASIAAPIDATATQAKALLAITTADVSGLGALATAASVSLTTQATGTMQAAQEPAHTGDVTNTAGSLALAIATGVVTNAKLATMPALTFKANNTAAVAAPSDLTTNQMQVALNLYGQLAARHLFMN